MKTHIAGRFIAMIAFTTGLALAQMVFEVASIRPADAETMRSGQFHRGSKGE